MTREQLIERLKHTRGPISSIRGKAVEDILLHDAEQRAEIERLRSQLGDPTPAEVLDRLRGHVAYVSVSQTDNSWGDDWKTLNGRPPTFHRSNPAYDSVGEHGAFSLLVVFAPAEEQTLIDLGAELRPSEYAAAFGDEA